MPNLGPQRIFIVGVEDHNTECDMVESVSGRIHEGVVDLSPPYQRGRARPYYELRS